MGMEAADPMRTPRARNASFNHAPTIRGYRGSIISGHVSRSAMLSISAFRAKFGLGVIWLSEVRVGGLFRVATPLVAGELPEFPSAGLFLLADPGAQPRRSP